ncbi:hypothetical protein JKP88DRAFT_288837 [Tribonema minus]|uniref:Glucose/Sorbosone dehydrogenase domain-containing protein n=1 Tax=Tribonema minus TaxID=303371 RepID=A0A835Z3Z9_9STRA|nr:hypothetical protein JKP88DRAFT_288837 [Tribonema minus]
MALLQLRVSLLLALRDAHRIRASLLARATPRVLASAARTRSPQLRAAPHDISADIAPPRCAPPPPPPGSCSPYAAHIASAADGLTGMCAPFCGAYVAACGAELGLAADFCATRSTASAYCYPDYAAENLTPSSTALQPYWPRLDGHGKLPTQPIGMFMKPGGNSWWIVNQRGQISQIRNIPGAEQLTPILDISDRVIQGGATGELGEMGLLGLAFSPDFLRTGYFYVNYINLARFTVVARFTFASGKPKKTAASEVQILSHWQPYENHNGGTLLFEPGDLADPYAAGKTGYNLYIPTGDGGLYGDPDPLTTVTLNSDSELYLARDGGLYGDPENRAQGVNDVNVRYGKILRITLPAGTNEGGYSIPEGNISAEVWAYGFRNPWKCTFDRAHLDAPQMWCGDVGQDKFEKVIRVLPRQNHGWRNYEGSSLYSPPKIAYVDPDFEYCHGGVTNAPKQCAGKTFTGESVTGG